jgi:hypothetical protein
VNELIEQSIIINKTNFYQMYLIKCPSSNSNSNLNNEINLKWNGKIEFNNPYGGLPGEFFFYLPVSKLLFFFFFNLIN